MKTAPFFDFIVDKETQTVTITREFSATRDLVWRAWTEPELLDQWWAPKPLDSKTIKMDFKVGGRRFYAMLSQEGAELGWQIHDYTSIDPKTNFKFFNAFADKDENPQLPGSYWNIDFSEDGDTTTVIVTIYNESLARMEKMIEMGFKEGFTACLEQLEKYLNN